MSDVICPNEGKQYTGQNAVSARTVYAGLIYGQTIAGATITATSQLGVSIQEEFGTGYARQAVVLGAMDSSGIIAVPAVNWANAGQAWQTTVSACFIASALTGGVALYVWDLNGGPYNMAIPATLAVPGVNYFFVNVGE